MYSVGVRSKCIDRLLGSSPVSHNSVLSILPQKEAEATECENGGCAIWQVPWTVLAESLPKT